MIDFKSKVFPKKALAFVLKIWVLINIISPLIFWLPTLIKEKDFTMATLLGGMIYGIAVGLLCSIPAMLVLFFVVWKSKIRKFALVLVMSILILATFGILDSRFITQIDSWLFPLSYLGVSAALIWLLRVEK